jgi:hypothetical protein
VGYQPRDAKCLAKLTLCGVELSHKPA